MKNDLISIIIPVYNVQDYLKRCLDSVINQSYKNIEIILVDDGSTDNSGLICDEYAKKDNRIIVIHKQNGGLSDARNKGIEASTGKYITFIDSDDYVELDYVEYLYKLICINNTDMSICKVNAIHNDTSKIEKNKSQEQLWSKEKVLKNIFYNKDFIISATGKLYSKKLFENIKFPVDKIFEDNATIYKVIDQNDKISVGFDCKYNYIIRTNSITTKPFNNNHLYLIKAIDEMEIYFENNNNLKKSIKRMKFWSRVSTLNRVINSKNMDYDLAKKLRKEALTYKSIMFDRNVNLRDKVSVISLFFGLKFYKCIWNIYAKKTGRL